MAKARLFVLALAAVLCAGVLSCSLWEEDDDSATTVAFQLDSSFVEQLTGGSAARSVSSGSGWTVEARLTGDYTDTVTAALSSGVVTLASVPEGASERLSVSIKKEGFQLYSGTSDSFTVVGGQNNVSLPLKWDPDDLLFGTWKCSYTYKDEDSKDGMEVTVVVGTVTFSAPTSKSATENSGTFTIKINDDYMSLVDEYAEEFKHLATAGGDYTIMLPTNSSGGTAVGESLRLHADYKDPEDGKSGSITLANKPGEGYSFNYSDFINKDISMSIVFYAKSTDVDEDKWDEPIRITLALE